MAQNEKEGGFNHFLQEIVVARLQVSVDDWLMQKASESTLYVIMAMLDTHWCSNSNVYIMYRFPASNSNVTQSVIT